MTDLTKLREAAARFNAIVDAVETRCMAVDGPVTPTLREMREEELADLWRQAQTIESSNATILAMIERVERVERVERAEKALAAAEGYLLNARIDLETGAPKRTAINTIDGGIKMVRAALSQAKEGEHG